jgi:hypothetical protein
LASARAVPAIQGAANGAAAAADSIRRRVMIMSISSSRYLLLVVEPIGIYLPRKVNPLRARARASFGQLTKI